MVTVFVLRVWSVVCFHMRGQVLVVLVYETFEAYEPVKYIGE